MQPTRSDPIKGHEKQTDETPINQNLIRCDGGSAEIEVVHQADHLEFHIASALRTAEDDEAREHLRRALQRLHPELLRGDDR